MCRRDKLWISMEYCGGGSLQDIYHGKNMHLNTHAHNLVLIVLFFLFSFIIFSLFNIHHLSFLYLSLPCFSPPVTGPLSESQIAYMSRETLQVVYMLYLVECMYIFE